MHVADIESLEVFLNEKKVGTLALDDRNLVVFEYDPKWIETGFSISPLSLPLRPGLFAPKNPLLFDGLSGVFADSLPDGWGQLLTDRMLREKGIVPESLTVLQRLSILGNSGKGALEYRPVWLLENAVDSRKSLDELAEAVQEILNGSSSDNLDVLYDHAGSSGGARPKVNITLDNEEWIVKFPASTDLKNVCQMEYDYHQCAKACGLRVAETKLFPSDRCSGYFASRRFDRNSTEKIHMISVSGLLETSHRIPSLDYDLLLKLTWLLTRSREEVWQMFSLMCFNVFAHNRDDHSNNFSFLYLQDHWELAPAYDLTWSNSMGGEHATMIHGNGKDPDMEELLAAADQAGLDLQEAPERAESIRQRTEKELGIYLKWS